MQQSKRSKDALYCISTDQRSKDTVLYGWVLTGTTAFKACMQMASIFCLNCTRRLACKSDFTLVKD